MSQNPLSPSLNPLNLNPSPLSMSQNPLSPSHNPLNLNPSPLSMSQNRLSPSLNPLNLSSLSLSPHPITGISHAMNGFEYTHFGM
ncbi:hypothetical protein EJ02DRAFT_454647 [Clathrospora elynae]|uniref:Uncharacterized protein n=1 Tax=Clathrospora elynae TaxID=706981 RepID=A0A6A5SYD2_9PLEO|nr:hypothetical protein EJ02DRAFT_454647 [Clathrospora elynae]